MRGAVFSESEARCKNLCEDFFLQAWAGLDMDFILSGTRWAWTSFYLKQVGPGLYSFQEKKLAQAHVDLVSLFFCSVSDIDCTFV